MTSVLRRYIGFQFFFNLLLWIPVFYEFQRSIGLSDSAIFGIQSIYYIAFCLLEIPTGFIADRFGYRSSIMFGALVLTVANVLPPMAPTFAGFLVHFVLIALARSLISGATSAYLYEYLKAHGEEARYKKIEGDARFYSLAGRVVAWSAVGWLMAWSSTSPYWISAANAAVAFVLAVTLPVVQPAVSQGETVDGAKLPLVAIRTLARSPLLLLIMLQGVGIFVMVRILQVNLYQPVVAVKGFDITAFGWIMAVMTIFEAVGAKLAHRLKGRFAEHTTVTVMTLVLSASLVIIAAGGQVLLVVGFCLFSFASGVAFPVQKQMLNDAIVTARLRATFLSLESIMDRAVCALAVLPLGGLVASGKIQATLYVTAAATAVAAAGVYLLLRRGYASWSGRTLPSALSAPATREVS